MDGHTAYESTFARSGMQNLNGLSIAIDANMNMYNGP